MRQFFAWQIGGTILAALSLMAGGAGADAETVHFTDFNLGPSNTLEISDVTVSQPYGGGRPASVAGGGLGSDGGIGPAWELDRQLHYTSGLVPDLGDGVSEGVLQLDVNGIINSISILPVFRIYSASGSLEPQTLPFQIVAYFSDGPIPPYVEITAPNGSPVTLYPNYQSLPPPSTTRLQLQIASNWSEWMNFVNYRSQHQSEEQTFQLGISVLALDYTPAPEPRSSGMLMAGLLLVGRKRLMKLK